MSVARLGRACAALCSLTALSALTGCDSGATYTGDEGPDNNPAPVDDSPPPATVLPTLFGMPTQSGAGTSSQQYQKADVKRDDLNYYFMANGWGPGFVSQTVSWNGTSFTVDSMQGNQGPKYQPAAYPTVFCGVYSDSKSGPCGLPKAAAAIQSLRTGWRWAANGNAGQYNAAYDIWLSTTDDIGGHSSFLMVWLRDPPGQQPSGSRRASNVSVANAPGVWDVWVGTESGIPCISYVRTEGHDSQELEIDVLDFMRDTQTRNITLPGTTVLSVAVGFEIWNGPITNLQTTDFYVQVQ
jgi:hypothetical protein